MATEGKLVDKNLPLLQLPENIEPSYEGDPNDLTPVRPDPVTYMPMRLEILPPKIGLDFEGLLDSNFEAKAAELDSEYRGEHLVPSSNIFESQNDYNNALLALETIPTLTMYINPSDLNRQYTKRVQEELTGQGHVIEHWGDEQVKLSASGKIGATYSDKTGLTRFFRRSSASYQQLMQLYLYYRNNGYIYEEVDTFRIGLVGRIQITYDTETWIGHFDAFTMSESADNPFTMDYLFEFTAREYYSDQTLLTGFTV